MAQSNRRTGPNFPGPVKFIPTGQIQKIGDTDERRKERDDDNANLHNLHNFTTPRPSLLPVDRTMRHQNSKDVHPEKTMAVSHSAITHTEPGHPSSTPSPTTKSINKYLSSTFQEHYLLEMSGIGSQGRSPAIKGSSSTSVQKTLDSPGKYDILPKPGPATTGAIGSRAALTPRESER
jgi:hypothetical protein